MKTLRTLLLVSLLVLATPLWAKNPTPVVPVKNPPNAAEQQKKHYVILVSLDGFRYDYIAKYAATHMGALAAAGATAPDGMLPSYPSLTFPNHITLVTGLYPEHHGIVGNDFYDPKRGEAYSFKDPKKNSDGSWYGGTPIWSLAEQQGMRSACLFWPGSEAEIAGKRPSYYLHFDDKLDDRKRIDQIIAWLKLPPKLRPHLITLYYSNTDHAGHEFGPESAQMRDAVHHVDDLMGELHARVDALKLPVDLIVVADHGMVNVQPPPLVMNEVVKNQQVHAVGELVYAQSEEAAAGAYNELKEHAGGRYTVYRRVDLPGHLHFNENPRGGDPVVVANGPFQVVADPPSKLLPGNHGFDPQIVPEMKAVFLAVGPDIRAGVKLPTFENIDVYPLIAHLLGLKSPAIDGELDPVAPALVDVDAAQLPKQIGAGVRAPVLVGQKDWPPKELASNVKRSGLCSRGISASLRVEADGSVNHVHLIRGVGYGIDESFIQSLREERFKPALENGRPVAVQLNTQADVSCF